MFVLMLAISIFPASSIWWLCFGLQIQDVKEGDGVKQVVLQSGASVGLCLVKPEDLKINILSSGITSENNMVIEKFLTVRVSTRAIMVYVWKHSLKLKVLLCTEKIQLEIKFLWLIHCLEKTVRLMGFYFHRHQL
jgi:hypothetical protein